MENKTRTVRVTIAAFVAVVIFLAISAFVTTPESVQQSFWSLIPPIIAIILALVTKEVYSSLFVGILTGSLLYSGFSFEGTMTHVFNDGIIASLSKSWNVGILIFLVILGTIVQLMNRTGGSAAFGNWATRRIQTREGAQLATIGLGVLIFIDDYFNCLTVGSVMRPVTDKYKVSRAKLAYLIDATAAPVCIIAPISSWAAAVSGFVEGENGLAIFIRTIPYNYYALLTLAMMIMIVLMHINYGPMAEHEYNATEKGDIYTTPDRPYADAADESQGRVGIVADMLIPIFSLIITMVYYLIRNSLSFEEMMGCLPDGFKQMVPAILILTLAWTLNGTTASLGAKEFVAGIIANNAARFASFLPAIIFMIAVGLSFATGTSWGTFGILIPIVVACFQTTDPQLMIIAMSACMAGSVCGDHCSPISDTTIMSSAGAQCNHINHVSTQMPYALTCAAVSAVTYVIAGLVRNAAISLLIGLVMMLAVMFIFKVAGGNSTPSSAAQNDN